MRVFSTRSLQLLVLSGVVSAFFIIGSSRCLAAKRVKPVSTTTAGDYKISVVGVRSAYGPTTIEPSGMVINSDTASGMDMTVHLSDDNFDIRTGKMRTKKKLNLILDVKVEPVKKHTGRNAYLLCGIHEKVSAEDDLGNWLVSSNVHAMWQERFVQMDYPEGNGLTAIHLYVPDKKAKSIKILQGIMYVQDSKQHLYTFKGKSLTRGASKSGRDAIVKLGPVSEGAKGIDFSLAMTPKSSSKSQSLKKKLEQAFTQVKRIEVTIEDNYGRIYHPSGKNEESMRESMERMIGKPRNGRKPKPDDMVKLISGLGDTGGNYHFDSLPGQAELRAVRCRVLELRSKSQVVNFELKNIPLPKME